MSRPAITAIIRARCLEAISELRNELGDSWSPSERQVRDLVYYQRDELKKLRTFGRDWENLDDTDKIEIVVQLRAELCGRV